MLYRDGAGLADMARDRPGFFSVAERPLAFFSAVKEGTTRNEATQRVALGD